MFNLPGLRLGCAVVPSSFTDSRRLLNSELRHGHGEATASLSWTPPINFGIPFPEILRPFPDLFSKTRAQSLVFPKGARNCHFGVSAAVELTLVFPIDARTPCRFPERCANSPIARIFEIPRSSCRFFPDSGHRCALARFADAPTGCHFGRSQRGRERPPVFT
jgi:hypothetical protein